MDLSYDWDIRERERLCSELDNISGFTQKFETERNSIMGIKLPVFFKRKVLEEKKEQLNKINKKIDYTYNLRRKILDKIKLIDSGRYSCKQEYKEFIEKDLKDCLR